VSSALLQVDGLDLYYGDAQALADVSLEIAAGEIVAIVGANGAGKSSLIRTIHGIEKPARGTVRFDGIDIAGWPSHRVCDAGIGHVAEGRQVFPNLSVLENLEMGATPRRARAAEKQTLERMFTIFPRLSERRRIDVVVSVFDNGYDLPMCWLARELCVNDGASNGVLLRWLR